MRSSFVLADDQVYLLCIIDMLQSCITFLICYIVDCTELVAMSQRTLLACSALDHSRVIMWPSIHICRRGEAAANALV